MSDPYIKIEGGWEGLEGMSIQLLAELTRDALDAVDDAALYLQNEIKHTLTGQRTGRAYRVTKTSVSTALVGPRQRGRKAKGRLHIASAPGEAPAVLFGHLRNSIGRTPAELVDGNTVQAEVGVGLGRTKSNEIAPNYARRLEWGGVDSRGVRILPRPYMEPTVVRTQPIIDAMLEKGVGG